MIHTNNQRKLKRMRAMMEKKHLGWSSGRERYHTRGKAMVKSQKTMLSTFSPIVLPEFCP